MTIQRIDNFSHTVKIRFEGVEFCVDESWLDGNAVKPRFEGSVVEKGEKAAWWGQAKNRVPGFNLKGGY